MKVALLETIEALVSAIKSKFLTKTEAESTYQPKATAINTSNIGSQSVHHAFSAGTASSANEAYSLHGGTAISSGQEFPTAGTSSMKYFLAKGRETDLTGLPPVNASVIHMGAYIDSSCDHQLALGNDGELYTRYIRNQAWQSWTRMAKASEIPDVSGFATEDWVTSNYFNLQEMNDNYYSIGDVDSMLENYLPKSGGTMTGNLTLNNSSLIVGMRIYESKVSDSNLVFQKWTQGDTKKVYQFGNGADILSFGSGFAEMRADYFFQKGQIRTEKGVKIGNVVLEFNSSTNTLNIKGASGQTVHVAVNGTTIA